MWIRNVLQCFLLISFFCFHVVAKPQTVVLVTGERAPYISQSQLDYGYVYQVVKEAFLRENYHIQVKFYPWSRAVFMTQQGEVDGIMPVYEHEADHRSLTMSSGFPGGSIGLIKRKDDPYTYPSTNLDSQLASLSGKSIVQIRGSNLLPEIASYPDIRVVNVNQSLQGLDILDAQRSDYMLTDKHTAAYLMIEQRPNYIGQLEFLRPPFAEKQFHVAFYNQSPNADKLLKAFNRGLTAIKNDGTLKAIQEQYGLLPREQDKNGKTHLLVGTVRNSDMLVMKSHIDEFEAEHPNIKVDWRVMDETILRRRLLSDHALSDGFFDVLTIGNYEVPIWAKKGWLNKLEQFPESYDVTDIFPTLRSSLSYAGNLYALPFYAESIMTYYRKDLFEQAGLVMPDVPTFDDIQNYARKIHNPSKQIYGICLRGKPDWGENIGIITSFVNAYGGRWFNKDWVPQLDSPEWKAALNFYQNILNNYDPPDVERNGYNENLKLFADGHCGIWIDATVAAGYLYNSKYSKVFDNVAITSAPKQKNVASWLWSWNFAISSLSKNKEEAKKFILWATSKEYIQHVGEETNWVSVPPGTRMSTYESENYLQSAPFSTFVAEALNSASSQIAISLPVPYKSIQYVDIPEFVAIGAQVGQYMAKMLNGSFTLDEALKYSQNSVYQQMVLSGYIEQ